MTEGYPSIQDYGGTATVDRKRLTADVARRFRGEEHDRPLDIVVAASAAQRRDPRDLIGPFRQLLWGHDRTSAERAGSSGRQCSDMCAECALYRDVRNVDKRYTDMTANQLFIQDWRPCLALIVT